MVFAIKAEIFDPRAKTFALTAQKTMYGGKHIAAGDAIFVFASEVFACFPQFARYARCRHATANGLNGL